jgi:hypothetical protein
VQWIAVPLDGTLRADRHLPARIGKWRRGEPVFLAEALLHGLAPHTVLADGDGAEVAFVPLRALTAAMTGDAAVASAVARQLASYAAVPAEQAGVGRRRGFELRTRPAA